MSYILYNSRNCILLSGQISYESHKLLYILASEKSGPSSSTHLASGSKGSLKFNLAEMKRGKTLRKTQDKTKGFPKMGKHQLLHDPEQQTFFFFFLLLYFFPRQRIVTHKSFLRGKPTDCFDKCIPQILADSFLC